MQPAKTDYLYFVSDGRGDIASFSMDLAGHARQVATYRKALTP